MNKPPYIITSSWIPFKADAITIYPFIFAKPGTSDELMRHEKVHIEQWRRGWWVGFLVKYVYYQLRYGYENNPYELEARNVSNHEDTNRG